MRSDETRSDFNHDGLKYDWNQNHLTLQGVGAVITRNRLWLIAYSEPLVSILRISELVPPNDLKEIVIIFFYRKGFWYYLVCCF